MPGAGLRIKFIPCMDKQITMACNGSARYDQLLERRKIGIAVAQATKVSRHLQGDARHANRLQPSKSALFACRQMIVLVALTGARGGGMKMSWYRINDLHSQCSSSPYVK